MSTFGAIRSPPKIRKIVVYDLEWIPETMKLTLAGVYDGMGYKSFTTVESLLRHLLAPEYRGAFLYAHAGGLADMPFLLEKLCDNRCYRIEASFSGSSAVVVRVKRIDKAATSKDEWIFLDSYWLLRDKLDHLAKSIGEKKTSDAWHCPGFPACGHKKKPEAICDKAPQCGCPSKEDAATCMFYAPFRVLEEYNRNDCVVLWRAITRFQEEILELGGELMMTIASTAMRLFRRKYLKEDILASAGLSDQIRPAYVASRVEPYRRSGTNLIEWDINSSFPYAMTFPTPGSLLGMQKTRPYGKEVMYFAKCVVHVPEMFLPPLPYRDEKEGGRVYFPTGTWEALFSRTDLDLLEEMGGRIERFEEAWVFESRHEFADYATTLYEMRRNTEDDFKRLLFKYLLNACYGKTAECREKGTLIVRPRSMACPHEGKHDTFDESGTIVATCVLELFPGAILLTDVREIVHEHVPIAAEVTSVARRTWYRFARECDEDLYYSDTDSLYTHHEFESSKELGGLKREKGVQHAEFLAAKFYRTDHFVKAKGFSRLNVDQFERIKRGDPYEFERQARIREMARSGKIYPRVDKHMKQLRLGHTRPKRKMAREEDAPSRPWDVREIAERWKKVG